MNDEHSQRRSAVASVTSKGKGPIVLAGNALQRTTDRLWKGLERFVNCGDSLANFEALGKAFPDFWPVGVWWYVRRSAGSPLEVESLAWKSCCHSIFLFYRDTLRSLWRPDFGKLEHWNQAGFLQGISTLNEDAIALSEDVPSALKAAWEEITEDHVGAWPDAPLQFSMIWGASGYVLSLENDFQRAFNHLFREQWRTRICGRCDMFFVARKPKQLYCGTACSAGSRLAANRDWWNRVGAKRRTNRAQKTANPAKGARKR